MLNILIHGISGAMGRQVYDLVKDENIIGFDHKPFENIKTYHQFPIEEKIDVIIDFSHYSMVDALVDYAVKEQIPTVICTTGLSDLTLEKIKNASTHIPIFQSGNMSLGINVLLELAKLGARSLQDFDIDIIEKHHNKKIDAPSGTAYMIAEAIQSIQALTLDHGRYGSDAKRNDNTIGMHAIRGGTITGEHTVLFAGHDETIEIKHQATSKGVFASGAVDAARFLVKQQPGQYNMSDLIGGLS